MTEDKSQIFPDSEISAQKCFIGQPVLISPNEAVLRIALGSDSLRNYIEDQSATLEEDKAIVNKLAFLGKEYNTLLK